MAAPLPNGTIPIMAGGGPQSAVLFQQQPVVVGGTQQLTPTNHIQSTNFIPGKRTFPRNPADEQCKIFVGGIGKTTTEEQLRTYFKKFGEIADSVIMQDRETGEPRGFAFVTFKSLDSVQAVNEQTNNGGHTLDGQVYLQVRKYFPKAEAYQNRQAQFKQYDAEKAQAMGNPMNNTYKGPMKVSPELKVFVGGIGIGTTEDDVKNYFSTFGKVEAVDMPYHHIYKCPKGFAFVGFETLDTVMAVVKDRYHQINGKTVEVKGADEQQAHLSKKRAETEMGLNRYAHARQQFPKVPGTIGTISGYGAYANLAQPAQQVIIPQVVGGQTQYAAVQVPAGAAAGGGGYVYDPTTNTYYQLPIGGAAATIQQVAGAPAYGGVQMIAAGGVAGAAGVAGVAGGAGGTVVAASPQQIQQRPGEVTAGMIAGISGAAGQVGAIYPSETSTFGPSRTHILSGGHQPITGTTDPHVVYSNAAALSGGESIPSRGFHPYGR